MSEAMVPSHSANARLVNSRSSGADRPMVVCQGRTCTRGWLISECRKQRPGALEALAKPAGRQPADSRDCGVDRLSPRNERLAGVEPATDLVALS
jgi:hypothetical protein